MVWYEISRYFDNTRVSIFHTALRCLACQLSSLTVLFFRCCLNADLSYSDISTTTRFSAFRRTCSKTLERCKHCETFFNRAIVAARCLLLGIQQHADMRA